MSWEGKEDEDETMGWGSIILKAVLVDAPKQGGRGCSLVVVDAHAVVQSVLPGSARL